MDICNRRVRRLFQFIQVLAKNKTISSCETLAISIQEAGLWTAVHTAHKVL